MIVALYRIDIPIVSNVSLPGSFELTQTAVIESVFFVVLLSRCKSITLSVRSSYACRSRCSV